MTSRALEVYNLLRELKCATALEIAERLGILRKVAQTYLRRLVACGLAERRTVGRRAVMYCAKDAPRDSPCGRRRNATRGSAVHERGGGGGLYAATRKRLPQVLELLQRDGCVSVGAVMRALRISHAKAYHMARVVLLLRMGVKMVIGNTAILCRDRAAAEETVSRLRETIHRLAVENGMRYATASKILRAALRDRDAHALLSRLVPVRCNAARFPLAVLTFVKDILQSLYGEPLKHSRKRIYAVSRPRRDYAISITDSVETHVVRVALPDDLAVALKDADVNEIALQAIEQLLARYRT
jgi:uncharacterized protein (DUF2384 family)